MLPVADCTPVCYYLVLSGLSLSPVPASLSDMSGHHKRPRQPNTQGRWIAMQERILRLASSTLSGIKLVGWTGKLSQLCEA